MIPVLSVQSPEHARELLQRQFGFEPAGDRMRFGATEIVVATPDALPDDLLPFSLDHVAFNVGDVDEVFARFQRNGALLDQRFTPSEPRDIPEFWDHGVRFVFFEGPDATPFEFCAKAGPGADRQDGHGHLAIRADDLDAVEAQAKALGAAPLVNYALPGPERTTHVRFLVLGDAVFELFDEPALTGVKERLGWIGLLPA